MAFLGQARKPRLLSVALSGRTMASRGLGSSSGGGGGGKKRVDFFYDVLSPYSWLGFEILCRYRPIWNMDLCLRPVFLGGIMKETGNQPPALLPKRGEYMFKDIRRVAKFYQVPMQIPKDFMGTVVKKGSLAAMRFVTAVDLTEPQFVESVSRELWLRVWSRDEDITQPDSILAAAAKAGLPAGQAQKLLEMTASSEVKDRLRATTDEALKYGAFGVPCSVTYVDNKPHLLFGSDRLELLAHLLGEKWQGPVPASPKL